MENVTLSQKLVNYEAGYMMVNHHDDFINRLREILHVDNSAGEFKEYTERVLADEVVSDHPGWFSDIVGNAMIIGAKMYYKMMAENETSKSQAQSSQTTGETGGFDIYKYAEENPYADYLDMHTGYIYHIADYMRARRFGLPTPGIAVSENGKIIGYARKV